MGFCFQPCNRGSEVHNALPRGNEAERRGLRGSHDNPTGWSPWSFRDVTFWDLKEATVFWLNSFKLFDFALLLPLQLCGIIHAAPFNTQHLLSRLAVEFCFPSLLRCIDVLCFQHMMLRSEKKVWFHNDWIHRQTFPRALYVKIISRIPGSQLCKHKSWCLMWVRGWERTAKLVSLGCLLGWLCGCRNDPGF